MSISTLVVVAVILFVIGNIMGLKPKASEVRVGDMRLFARKLDLNPKLVPIPDWLVGVADKGGMIAQYTLINDEWRLPARYLLWIDGAWQGDTVLDILPPKFCESYIKGVMLKANCVTIYWQDEPYAKSFSVRDERAMTVIEQDLMQLQAFLVEMGNQP